MSKIPSSYIAAIGGTFIYSEDPAALALWYKETLDIQFEGYEEYGCYCASFPYKEINTGKDAYVVWSINKSQKRPKVEGKVFCINYRVFDLEQLVNSLQEKQIEVKGIENHPEGKFAWITDPEGNYIELWEDTNLTKQD